MATGDRGGTPAVRLMAAGDIGFCVAQTAREGWTSTPDDFGVHLAHDPDGCFVAAVGGEPAAMVTTTAYRSTGWIGNLIVAPEHRGKGLGSVMMERAIGSLESHGLATLRLEADPLGINIYRRLGFVDEYDSPRFRRDGEPTPDPAQGTPMEPADVRSVAPLDAAAFGDDRSRLLPVLLGAARAAFRVPARGAIAGYLMLVAGVHGFRIGPWVAEEPGAASNLLRAALAFAGARTVTVAVPGPNRVGQAMLREAGFRETPSSLRMARGPAAGHGHPESVYALANGAVG